MPESSKSVLITGCSDGGLGAALASAFDDAGFRVYATARNPEKMGKLKAAHANIELMTLDVSDESSIAACVSKLDGLDMLVNNAGSSYHMPVADLSIAEAKKVFDMNVWSFLAVTQSLLPLLLKSKGTIVNQTSVASATTLPWQSAYNASKAAMAMFSDTQRMELAPFGITVVELKTGSVKSTFIKNRLQRTRTTLPEKSIYEPAREAIERAMSSEEFEEQGEPADLWSKRVVGDLSKKKPPNVIWRGSSAGMVRIMSVLPAGTADSMIKRIGKIDVLEAALRK